MNLAKARVQRILKYQTQRKIDIYCSPIYHWLAIYVAILVQGAVVVGVLMKVVGGELVLNILMGHFLASLLLSLFCNNSVAVGADAFYIVNPNLPFGRCRKLSWNTIKSIKITEYKGIQKYFFWFFLMRSVHIEVMTKGRKKRYYCVSIEEDYFERPTIEGTTDGLYSALHNRGVAVQLDMDN